MILVSRPRQAVNRPPASEETTSRQPQAIEFQHESCWFPIRAGSAFTMYLSEETVRRTLTLLARHSAPGSSLMMDYAGRAFIDILEKHPNHPQHKYTSNDIDAYDAQEQGIRSCRACRTQPGRETVMMAGAFVVAVVLWVVLEAYTTATTNAPAIITVS